MRPIHATLAWSFFFVAIGLAHASCSSDSSPSPVQAGGQGGDGSSGSGGSSATGTGGGSSDAGSVPGSDASPGEPDTLEGVCRAAVGAQCQRRADCGMSSGLACFGFVNLCPEYYFGPGSTRTLEAVRACISAIRQLPCSDLAVDALPDCLIGGGRAAGMGCAFGSQCTSAYCQGGSQQCGMCSEVGQVGSACVAGDCAPGSFCNRANSMCEAITSIVHGAAGAKCNQNTSPVLGCAGDLVCDTAPSSPTMGTCTKLVSEGAACTGLGGLPCAPGLVCLRNADGGGSCTSLASCGATPCDASSYCNYSMTPPACIPRGAQGKPCLMSADTGQIPCVAGTMCTPTSSGGTQGICLKPGDARAVTCTEGTACPYPLKCVDGHCGPLDPASCN